MKRWIFSIGLIFIFFAFALPVQGNDGYKIKVKINGLADTSIFLAYHFGDKQYMADTVRLDSKGAGVFEGDEPLDGGVYLVVLPRRNYFEIIVNEQQFSIENDTSDFQQNFKSTGSLENKLFYDDVKFISVKHNEKRTLQSLLEAAEGKDKKQRLKEQLLQLDEEVKNYRKNLIKEHPNTFYAKFLKSLEEPEIPDPPKDENGNVIDSSFAYNYYKAHYFDNLDMTDDRMLRTPTFHNRVMNYINKVTPQIPDSISAACGRVVELSRPNDEMFKYWLISLLNQYAKSKIMGMDAVYVYLVEKYYANGDAYWVSEDDLYRITDRAKSLKPTLLGKVAPNMLLRTPDQKVVPLHAVQAKYTLLFIYAPDCGHCKKETPKILDAYHKIVDTMGIDLKVYAAPTLHLHKGDYDDNKRPVFSEDPDDVNEWPDFIKKFKIEEWINVADLHLQDNFRERYDVSSTPKVYLLDKDKKIIAKRFNADQLVQIIEDMERRGS